MKRITGTYITVSTVGEKVKAFIPTPIPPIDWSPKLREKFDQAVLSSMIEGTQSSLSDLLLFELGEEPGVPLDDVAEVSNYVAALNHGIQRLDKGFPLSLRLIKDIHEVLLSKGRGSQKQPGEFRNSQNWIGGTRPGNALFVPSPPEKVIECMGSLEQFLHDKPHPTPILLKAALAHVQFETIHPFLDGNGRLGRLLITFLFYNEKILHDPILYLSLYFKTHRHKYYELLNSVRIKGDWEAWLYFFAEAVIETSSQAVNTVKELIELTNSDRDKIKTLGRASESCLKVHQTLLERPITTSNWLVKKTELTAATINKSLEHLIEIGILKELTRKKRNRLFSYPQYIEIMNKGTESITRKS